MPILPPPPDSSTFSPANVSRIPKSSDLWRGGNGEDGARSLQCVGEGLGFDMEKAVGKRKIWLNVWRDGCLKFGLYHKQHIQKDGTNGGTVNPPINPPPG